MTCTIERKKTETVQRVIEETVEYTETKQIDVRNWNSEWDKEGRAKYVVVTVDGRDWLRLNVENGEVCDWRSAASPLPKPRPNV